MNRIGKIWTISVFVLFSAIGCSENYGLVQVTFHIVSAPEETPFQNARELVMTLEQRGKNAPVFKERYDIDQDTGTVSPLYFGEDFSLTVEGIGEELVLARGRSFPFDVLENSSSVHPDLFVGRLGRFSLPLGNIDFGSQILGISRTAQGAFISTEAGELFRYDAHSRFEKVNQYKDLTGAIWTEVYAGMLLAVGGSEASAYLIESEEGQIVATLSNGTFVEQKVGMALTALPGGKQVLAIGGRASLSSQPCRKVSLISILEDRDGNKTLEVELLHELPQPRSDGQAIAVPVQDDKECPCSRTLLFGGKDHTGTLSDIVMLDPENKSPPIVFSGDSALDGATAVVLDTGLLLLAGGFNADANGLPIDNVRLLSVRPGAINFVSPTPPPLYNARAHAESVNFGSGLALIIGGVGLGGNNEIVALDSSELFEVRTDIFPGEIAPTGNLPTFFSNPLAITLYDRSILVADESGLAVYIPPRDGNY